jgi:phosphoribosylformylglycinamidine synthase I
VKVAVVQFPGSNCDQDALFALREDVGVRAEYVWQDETSLSGYDAVFLPGGFSFGDYLRCGAIAARAPILAEVARFAEEGRLVLGVCNGFQVLCEAGLLPGALLLNERRKFLCQTVHLLPASRKGPWMQDAGRVLELPIAHGEGRYVCDDETLERLRGEGRIAFLYCDRDGQVTPDANVNGSKANIAGVLNGTGNVLGLMPHPERATKGLLGGTDGLDILCALATGIPV